LVDPAAHPVVLGGAVVVEIWVRVAAEGVRERRVLVIDRGDRERVGVELFVEEDKTRVAATLDDDRVVAGEEGAPG